MTQGRCMFASTTIDNKFVYVYGGISGSQGDRPVLNTNLVERYDADENKWYNIIVENAPKLSSFGWC